MDYDKFKNQLLLAVLSREEVAGKFVSMTDEELCIWWETSEKKATVYWRLAELYLESLHGEWGNLVDGIIHKLRMQAYLHRVSVTVRPLNYNENREELSDGVCRRFGEIALAVYGVAAGNREERIMSCISRRGIWQLEISEDSLWEEALQIACRTRPPRLYYGTEVRRAGCVDEGVFMPGERGNRIAVCAGDTLECMCGYRLTILGYTNGAVALFYPGVCEKLAELFEGDFYVGFISVHEAVIHPVRHKILGDMKEAVLRANVLCESRERLTSRVYRYCAGQKRLVEV